MTKSEIMKAMAEYDLPEDALYIRANGLEDIIEEYDRDARAEGFDGN